MPGILTSTSSRPTCGYVRRRHRGTGDDGFTLVEVIVAIGLITALMVSLGVYFTSSIRTSRNQAQIQAATRLAETGMERARGLGGAALLAGRVQCGTCSDVSAFAGNYLVGTTRWDAKATSGTPTVPYDDQPESIVVNGVAYARYWLVGRCWQDTSGGTCSTDSTLAVPMVRLVIAVVWPEPTCAPRLCVRASTALFSSAVSEPVFP